MLPAPPAASPPGEQVMKWGGQRLGSDNRNDPPGQARGIGGMVRRVGRRKSEQTPLQLVSFDLSPMLAVLA